MKYNIDYEIAGAIFLVFFILFVKTQYSTNTKSNNLFIFLLSTVLGSDVLDMITAVTISYPDLVPVWLNYTFNVMLFIVGFLCVSTVPVYIRSFVPIKIKRTFFEYISYFLSVAYILLILTTPFTKLLIYFDENKIYTPGKLYAFIFAFPMLYMIYAVIETIRLHQFFNRKQVLCSIAFVGITALGELLQILFFRDILILYYAATIGGVVMLFAFETPDYQELIKTTKELEENKNLLDIAVSKETELAKLVRASTKTASWAIYFDENAQSAESNWSDDFFIMLGYDPKSISEDERMNLWQDSLYIEDKEKALRVFADAMLYDGSFNMEYRMTDRFNEVKWVRGKGEAKYNEAGRIVSYQGIIQDINEEKIKEKLNEERLLALESLEKSEQALKDALNKAEVANKAKSRFLSNMSHDIRTPMNAIVGFTDIAKENINDASQVEECLDRIQSSSRHLLELINDVLDMSRIESGKTTIEVQPNSLKEILDDIHGMIESDIKGHGLNFALNYDGIKHDEVLCDRLHLNQVLINLLGNSIKFTKEGGNIRVVALEKSVDDKMSNYVFVVKDTGVGMSAEFLEKLFEPFEREHTTTISKIQGTGLGMSITKTLVDMMGGTIEVKSEINVGSTFTITIPFEKCEYSYDKTGDDVTGLHKNNYVNNDQMLEALAGRKILLVDDNSTNRIVANKQLTSRGFVVVEAEDGVSALEKIDSDEKFDLVLMDIQMPGISGYEATDRIRALPDSTKANIPILAMTADAFDDDKKKSIEHKMNGHVSKPFKIDELIKVIYDTLA